MSGGNNFSILLKRHAESNIPVGADGRRDDAVTAKGGIEGAGGRQTPDGKIKFGAVACAPRNNNLSVRLDDHGMPALIPAVAIERKFSIPIEVGIEASIGIVTENIHVIIGTGTSAGVAHCHIADDHNFSVGIKGHPADNFGAIVV